MFGFFRMLLIAALATTCVHAVDYSAKIQADLKQIDGFELNFTLSCNNIPTTGTPASGLVPVLTALRNLTSIPPFYRDAALNSNNSHVPSQAAAQAIIDYTSKPLLADLKVGLACIVQKRATVGNFRSYFVSALNDVKRSYDIFLDAWYLKVPAPSQRTNITAQRKDGDAAINAAIASLNGP